MTKIKCMAWILMLTATLGGCATGGVDYGMDYVNNGVLVDSFANATKSTSPPNANQRAATLGDVMQLIQAKRDMKWVTRELGKPDSIVDLKRGYRSLSWASYDAKGNKCEQTFHLSPDDKILGWHLGFGCSLSRHRDGSARKFDTYWGTMPKSAPIPIGNLGWREATFSDYLSFLIGSNASQVDAALKAAYTVRSVPYKVKSLGNGNTMREYKLSWTSKSETLTSIYSGFDPSHLKGYETAEKSCTYSVTFNAQGKVSGWSVGSCGNNENIAKANKEAYGIVSSAIRKAPDTKK